METCEYDVYAATHVVSESDGSFIYLCGECAVSAEDEDWDVYEIGADDPDTVCTCGHPDCGAC